MTANGSKLQNMYTQSRTTPIKESPLS